MREREVTRRKILRRGEKRVRLNSVAQKERQREDKRDGEK